MSCRFGPETESLYLFQFPLYLFLPPHRRHCQARCFAKTGSSIYGHVNWAAPKILSCEPRSGFIIEEDPVPARIVAVPVNPGTHCANPFWFTVTRGFIFPIHMPVFDPAHHITSLLVSCTGDGGLLKAPVALNETLAIGKVPRVRQCRIQRHRLQLASVAASHDPECDQGWYKKTHARTEMEHGNLHPQGSYSDMMTDPSKRGCLLRHSFLIKEPSTCLAHASDPWAWNPRFH
jgi:hypothetical protein